MSNPFEEIVHSIEESTKLEREDVSHSEHATSGLLFLTLRNCFVLLAVILFVIEFFVSDEVRHILKACAYFSGAVAYIFEILVETDLLTKKVPHHEMFMLYCFGPLYILLGLSYLF